jgi:hypothetical protein
MGITIFCSPVRRRFLEGLGSLRCQKQQASGLVFFRLMYDGSSHTRIDIGS